MKNYTSSDLSRAVAAICPDIQSSANKLENLDEDALWLELSICILSSQVPFPLATAAATAIENQNILSNRSWKKEALFKKLHSILQKPLVVENATRRYRFPEAKAKQLAEAHNVITNNFGTFRGAIETFSNASEARAWLVEFLPGLGPKQASMFLRNIGSSYDLAILDRHVLKYMSQIGIYSEEKLFVSGLSNYHRLESKLRKHAEDLDCPVGLLDWAIWIVMRVAGRNLVGASI